MPQRTLTANGKLLDLKVPKVMGILNVTPDSFFDGGRYQDSKQVLDRVNKMLKEGADIVDIGGMSSRPGARVISVEEERERVIPIVRMIRGEFPDVWLSIDTVRSQITRETADLGIDMINDISAGGIDPQMFEVVGKTRLPYVLMHMLGTPMKMQDNPQYSDVVSEVLRFLIQKMRELRKNNVIDVILDPGFGFGKSVSDNFILLKNLHAFKILDVPIMAGLSRKSMICKVIGKPPEKALSGTVSLHMVALQQGARILRVHDVEEAVEVIKLYQQLEASLKPS